MLGEVKGDTDLREPMMDRRNNTVLSDAKLIARVVLTFELVAEELAAIASLQGAN
jgi:hypothetical protein